MNKLRISFSEKDVIKGSIKLEGDTTFVFSCMVSVVEHLAKAYDQTPDRILQEIWHTYQKEQEAKNDPSND